MKIIATSLLIAPLLFAGCCSDKAPRSASNQRHPISPQHFWFDYPYQPSPGKRYWTAVEKTWIEQYESGVYSRFKVAGRTTLEGTSGTLLVKTSGDPQQTWTGNEGNFQVFIPDIGSEKMQIWYRNKTDGKWQEWRSLAEMKGIE